MLRLKVCHTTTRCPCFILFFWDRVSSSWPWLQVVLCQITSVCHEPQAPVSDYRCVPPAPDTCVRLQVCATSSRHLCQITGVNHQLQVPVSDYRCEPSAAGTCVRLQVWATSCRHPSGFETALLSHSNWKSPWPLNTRPSRVKSVDVIRSSVSWC